MLQKGVSNVNLVQKEPTAQLMDCQLTFFALTAPILMWKAGTIVSHVMQGSGVQVLEWRPLKHAPMEHTVTQLVPGIVFCVQKVIGEILSSASQNFIHALFNMYSCS